MLLVRQGEVRSGSEGVNEKRECVPRATLREYNKENAFLVWHGTKSFISLFLGFRVWFNMLVHLSNGSIIQIMIGSSLHY